MLKITTRLIIDELVKRNFRYEMLDEPKTFYRFWDSNSREYILRSNTTYKSSAAGYLYANNKTMSTFFANDIGVPTPDALLYTNESEAEEFLYKHHRLVVKPVDAAHGNGITIDVRDKESLKSAVEFAQKYSSKVVLQELVQGDDYRVLIIGGKFVAAAIREPAFVTGDGISTIDELIKKENQDPDRGVNYQTKLNKIDLAAAQRFLDKKINDVPKSGEKINVVGVANIGKGGVSIDVTDNISDKIVEYSEKLASKLGLELCGVDFIYDAESKQQIEPKFIEINASPTFGLHHFPYEGEARDVTKLFVDWLITKP